MLIAIEGVDGSGKETQTTRLFNRLKQDGYEAKKITFPDYDSPAAGALKMYLNGEFGRSPSDVNPYVASAFFAIDRFASWKKDWGRFLAQGGIVIADRYVMSNMIHQGAKIEDEREFDGFLSWLSELEFIKFGLPKPELVVFLDMSMSFRMEILDERERTNAKSHRSDIHEKDTDYLENVHQCARRIAESQGWHKVSADVSGRLKTIDEIHQEIYDIVIREILQYNRDESVNNSKVNDCSACRGDKEW